MRSRVGEKSCGDKSLKNSFKIMESHRYNFKFIMQPNGGDIEKEVSWIFTGSLCNIRVLIGVSRLRTLRAVWEEIFFINFDGMHGYSFLN